MRKLVYILICVVIFTGVSCKGNSRLSDNEGEVDGEVFDTTEVKDTDATHHDKYGELFVKYESLNGDIIKLDGKIGDVQENVKSLKEKKADLSKVHFLFVCLVVAVVVVVLFFSWRLRRIKKEFAKRLAKFEKDNEDNIIHRQSGQWPQTTDALSKKDVEKIVAEKLEVINLEELRRQIQAVGNHAVNNTIVKSSEEKRHCEKRKGGYFGINSDDKFYKKYDSRKEECYFVMEYIAEDKAEFWPICIKALRGSRSISQSVEIVGCDIEEANSMEVEERGLAYLIDDGVGCWHIERKAKVKLVK